MSYNIRPLSGYTQLNEMKRAKVKYANGTASSKEYFMKKPEE